MKTFLLLSSLLTTVQPAPEPGAQPARVPVVVELFTSEGCSSCPAADAALRELVRTQAVPGVEVIALGEHVDYWNRLGWKDGFSAAAYTPRQQQYAAGFGTGAYTPQAVVNGRYEFVGSRTAELAASVAKAAKAPQAAVSVVASGGTVQVHVGRVPPGSAATEVLLRHAAVVRQLASLGRVAANGTFVANAPLALAPAWKRPNLRLVALVQEIASRRIVGAAAAPNGSLQ